ncbi:MAG: lytic transglycosylase domain-containing protein [Spirochaetes bacterium]|nr:lytic transglycosylase domain-containing protein [Brevinematales bacterium]MCL1959431.1 lytic transglycosylase domain-containing protein [Spirochaetota bacterium]
MNFCKAKIEAVIPLFLGVLCSVSFCALIAVNNGVYKAPSSPPVEIISADESEEDEWNFSLAETDNIHDPVLEYFRNSEYREWVIDFFSYICSNRKVVQAILKNADKFDVPPSLAFALSWEESKFNPNAINRYNRDGSIDRGLFQLNNKSFPNLDASFFFDVDINAYYGIAHLRHCLNSGNNEISALAMYNAGTGRVKTTGAPEVTLRYISRILENRRKIESRFHVRLIKEEKARLAEVGLDEKDENVSQPYYNRTLIIASPL